MVRNFLDDARSVVETAKAHPLVDEEGRAGDRDICPFL